MPNKLRERLVEFTTNDKQYPILSALGAGLYPLIYYYNNNFSLVNSWGQFVLFVLWFLVVPIVVFQIVSVISKKVLSQKKYGYVLPVLNFVLFGGLMILSTYGVGKKRYLLVTVAALGLGFLLQKHFKKILVIQFILILLAVPKLIANIQRHVSYDRTWMSLSDNIEEVKFTRKPNVYVIQPDGYPNFEELKRGYYNFDNSQLEGFLQDNGFTLYEGFRSNYFSTLSSNSSMFAMKHHYYNNPPKGENEFYNARDIIVGQNSVVPVFKKNGYNTSLLLEKSYLLLNKPELQYDFCNIAQDDLSFLARGFEITKDLKADLENSLQNQTNEPNFYFIEKISPGHITTYKNRSLGKEKERLNYLEKLKSANDWLKEMVQLIQTHDDNALIVIVADHGGFVGMDYTLECKEKQTNRDLIYSIFSTALAVKWPENPMNYDKDLKTNVNLFRVLFSYLSENPKYLENLESDTSFVVLKEGAPFGVYQYIDEEGEVVFLRKE
ncbi:sulfatase-like hydrolase/transferase [Mangrovimonas sp. DI 80]|uniref:sulfatase-like hydrolase/transferase n=1 Tax=Mangrovimonas sp. DI 80 TaxID=1779330 RepID=UPI0009777BF1|nr:sulfatase-like hydrolase/transferase [Mangrovimonas sp. DI 80]OMP30226.1 hypothetical protein BKM32_12650 [Mangrovimonas sp. DI 80]